MLPLQNCSIYPAYLQHTCSILLQYICSIVAALLQSCCNVFAIQFQCRQHECSMFQICKLCCKYAANMQIRYASMQHMLQCSICFKTQKCSIPIQSVCWKYTAAYMQYRYAAKCSICCTLQYVSNM